MATSRRLHATLQLTPYVHCTSKCVRGAFLCGIDRTTGVNYTHRRDWLRQRVLELADIFSIKLLAFSILENHFHVVLKVDQDTADDWTDHEVLVRWHKLYKGTELSRKAVQGDCLNQIESKLLAKNINRWRCQLYDISWFMRCTKEPLARKSNKEDGCKGRFWEGRFYSQALLDLKAVISCMVYVDLNPLRAKMVTFPEKDKHTSLHYRTNLISKDLSLEKTLPKGLMGLEKLFGNAAIEQSTELSTVDYLSLVDQTARETRKEKRGVLLSTATPILERLGVNLGNWEQLEHNFNHKFYKFVGGTFSLDNACRHLGLKSIWGRKTCRKFFDTQLTVRTIAT